MTDHAAHRLGIRHPIIQGPFGGGLSSIDLASAVSNLGGLGSFGVEHLAPEEIGPLADALRARTDRPFNLNLWVDVNDDREAMTAVRFDDLRRVFEPYFEELGVAAPERPERFHAAYEDQFEALIEAGPPVFSFVFGIPPADHLRRCRARGIVTVGAATSLAEALALEDAGVDAVVTTGFEAGGHRVSFLKSAEDSLMGTFVLTQLASARLKIPVIAAGGIADGRGLRGALALGAGAVQIGTAFLACEESGASPEHRAALFGDGAHDTVLTRAFSGRLARSLRNRWTETMPAQVAPYPVQSWFTGRLKPAARAQGRTDLVSLWGGQIAPNLRHRDASSLMADLIQATEPAR